MTRTEGGARQRGRVDGRVQVQDEVGDDCGLSETAKAWPVLSVACAFKGESSA